MVTRVIRDARRPHDSHGAERAFRAGLAQILGGIAASLRTDERGSGPKD